MKTKYPNLHDFFGSYFHQDCFEEASTAMDIVRNYAAEWPPAGISGAVEELRRLLAETRSESGLSEALQKLGSYYEPSADGLTHEAWLKQIQQFLEEATALSK